PIYPGLAQIRRRVAHYALEQGRAAPRIRRRRRSRGLERGRAHEVLHRTHDRRGLLLGGRRREDSHASVFVHAPIVTTARVCRVENKCSELRYSVPHGVTGAAAV